MSERITRRQAIGTLIAAGVAGCMPEQLLSPSLLSATDSVTLVGAGDCHALLSNPAKLTGAMMRDFMTANPSAIPFALGDNAGDTGSVVDYQHFDLHWGFLRQYGMRMQIGNHDVKADPSARAYYDYCTQNGLQSGGFGKGYYAETLGNWRVYWMNSEYGQTAETTWLTADLKAHLGLRIAAFWHKPLFVSTGNNPIPSTYVKPWWRLLTQYGAELVVTAHTHRYERFAPLLVDGTRSVQGLREFIVGTGGGFLSTISSVHPASEVQAVERGIFRLDLNPDSYGWRFTDIHGVVRDEGTQTCKVVV
jgi:hypothetical protein